MQQAPIGITCAAYGAFLRRARDTGIDSFRLYVAGDIPLGLYPPELKGQAEIINSSVLSSAQAVVLK